MYFQGHSRIVRTINIEICEWLGSTTVAYGGIYFIVEEMETEQIEWSVTGGTRMQVSVSTFFPLAEMLFSLENLFEAVTSFGVFKLSQFISNFTLLNYQLYKIAVIGEEDFISVYLAEI